VIPHHADEPWSQPARPSLDARPGALRPPFAATTHAPHEDPVAGEPRPLRVASTGGTAATRRAEVQTVRRANVEHGAAVNTVAHSSLIDRPGPPTNAVPLRGHHRRRQPPGNPQTAHQCHRARPQHGVVDGHSVKHDRDEPVLNREAAARQRRRKPNVVAEYNGGPPRDRRGTEEYDVMAGSILVAATLPTAWRRSESRLVPLRKAGTCPEWAQATPRADARRRPAETTPPTADDRRARTVHFGTVARPDQLTRTTPAAAAGRIRP
jgi:hypothetical protein